MVLVRPFLFFQAAKTSSKLVLVLSVAGMGTSMAWGLPNLVRTNSCLAIATRLTNSAKFSLVSLMLTVCLICSY